MFEPCSLSWKRARLPISIANDVDGPWDPCVDGIEVRTLHILGQRTEEASGFGLQALGIAICYSSVLCALLLLFSGNGGLRFHGCSQAPLQSSDFDAAAASRRSIGMVGGPK